LKQIKDPLLLIAMILPFVAFLFMFYSEHNQLKADVGELQNDRLQILETLGKINEKLNIIDGKLSEHVR
jgi:hypothetical protein